MKHLPAAIFLIVVAIVGWKIGSVLSRDALSMALGVIFGMMAGIPAALIAVSLKRQVPAEQPSNQQGERPLLPAPSHARRWEEYPHPPGVFNCPLAHPVPFLCRKR